MRMVLSFTSENFKGPQDYETQRCAYTKSRSCFPLLAGCLAPNLQQVTAWSLAVVLNCRVWRTRTGRLDGGLEAKIKYILDRHTTLHIKELFRRAKYMLETFTVCSENAVEFVWLVYPDLTVLSVCTSTLRVSSWISVAVYPQLAGKTITPHSLTT